MACVFGQCQPHNSVSVWPGLGKPGDTVSVKVTRAQNELLAFGRAVYASPENQEKYRNVADHSPADDVKHSSIYSAQVSTSDNGYRIPAVSARVRCC